MTRHSIGAADHAPLPRSTEGTSAPSPLNHSAGLITGPADKVSSRGFLEALGLTSADKRVADLALMHQQCIRAIERGDLYGWPPMMVAHCRKVMAERVSLVEVERISPTRVAL